MKEKEAIIILPTQLLPSHPLLEKGISVYCVEHPQYFSAFNYHKQKIILHRASMKAFYDTCKKKHTASYIDFKKYTSLWSALKKDKVTKIIMLDPVDHTIEKDITARCKKAKISLELFDTPVFLTDTDWINTHMKGKKSHRMHNFYVQQRKRLGIMVRNGKPVGGSWSFDEDNRKTLPEKQKIPARPRNNTSKYVAEAKRYTAKHFASHPGDSKTFIYPVTTTQARAFLKQFLSKKFKLFGDYQDAIKKDTPFLFHSLLSSSLNIGLITPQEVVDKTLSYAKKHKTPINSLEGFIRQIIGWREFVRALYMLEGQKQAKSNFFSSSKNIPKAFWDGTTDIIPIDNTIERILETAYAHHIERLMVLGNFMLLSCFKPKQVYTWFMELFIDAYDWVMVPNVYGMALYADGGSMTTKPYISSSQYILKMSNYKKGLWCDIWDALYWYFIYKHKAKLSKIGRLKIMVSYLRRLKPDTLKKHVSLAKKYLKTGNVIESK